MSKKIEFLIEAVLNSWGMSSMIPLADDLSSATYEDVELARKIILAVNALSMHDDSTLMNLATDEN